MPLKTGFDVCERSPEHRPPAGRAGPGDDRLRTGHRRDSRRVRAEASREHPRVPGKAVRDQRAAGARGLRAGGSLRRRRRRSERTNRSEAHRRLKTVKAKGLLSMAPVSSMPRASYELPLSPGDALPASSVPHRAGLAARTPAAPERRLVLPRPLDRRGAAGVVRPHGALPAVRARPGLAGATSIGPSSRRRSWRWRTSVSWPTPGGWPGRDRLPARERTSGRRSSWT